jgi:hypothetical protein
MAGPTPPPALATSDTSEDDDDGFWRVQHTVPALTVATAPKPMPYVELLVASPAGKPVLHFIHGLLPAAGARTEVPYDRPNLEVQSLCAASAAFAGVAPEVRSIITPGGVVFFASTHALHVTAAAADPTFPVPVLASLARLAVAFLALCLSANLVVTLTARPNFDLAPHIAPFRSHLDTLLSHALAHPLPYASLSPPSLPCPTSPSSRADIVDIVRCALAQPPALATHALLVTASPPFPRKLIAVAAPSAAPLTPLDTLILASLPPADPSDSIGLPATSCLSRSSRVYLQSTGHSQASVVSMTAVDLRLNPDDYDTFQAAVGGRDWRPEWESAGGDVVWVIVVARLPLFSTSASSSSAASCPAVIDALLQAQKAAAQSAAAIQSSLDMSRATRDLIVAMERPWMVADVRKLTNDPVKLAAVHGIIIMSHDRMSATIGASDHELGAAFTNALLSQRGYSGGDTAESLYSVGSNLDQKDETEDLRRKLSFDHNDIWRSVDDARGFQIFGCGRATMAAFSLSTPRAVALFIFTDCILPWTKRYHKALLPEFERVFVQPRTLLGDLFAPFPN